jgi:hypothetical protein
MNMLIHRAYIRDGKGTHTGEALLLACVKHTKGRGRNSKDMRDVQKLMRDVNLDRTTKERG